MSLAVSVHSGLLSGLAIFIGESMMQKIILVLMSLFIIGACSNDEGQLNNSEPDESSTVKTSPIKEITSARTLDIQRKPYFGDLHIHTSYSLDGYIIFNRTTPRDAYVFARGGEIEFYKNPRKLEIPLDFASVTEHAEFLGESLLCSDPSSKAFLTTMCSDMRNEDQDPELENRTFVNVLLKVFKAKKPVRPVICGNKGEDCLQASRTRWKEIQQIADDFNKPGEFTTFIGYEWTGQQGGNRHRNVIFRNNIIPDTAWSMIEVPTVEELWAKLDEECLPPCDVLTISHNSNQSNGLRFAGVNPDGSPFNKKQAAYRAAHEPLVEIMQFKGESECRLGLGTEDEFCNFENFDLRPICPQAVAAGSSLKCAPECDSNGQPKGCIWARNFTRNALKIGLEFEENIGANPYKFGVLGSTDTHNSNPGNTSEHNYMGNFGFLDAKAEDRLIPALKTGFKLLSRNPGALAGVWAEEITRESIFNSLERRETFGTSGTRILIRFFGGWNFPEQLEDSMDLAKLGYENGVAMGADLPSAFTGIAPRFLIWAAKGIDGRKLQRAQIVKGWLENGESQEQVYDVLCADGAEVNKDTLRCPANAVEVNLNNCSVVEDSGAVELKGVWEDPDFDAGQRAFYYARVLENPGCRWSTYEANRLGRKPPVEAPSTIQERAWSSPIWYSP